MIDYLKYLNNTADIKIDIEKVIDKFDSSIYRHICKVIQKENFFGEFYPLNGRKIFEDNACIFVFFIKNSHTKPIFVIPDSDDHSIEIDYIDNYINQVLPKFTYIYFVFEMDPIIVFASKVPCESCEEYNYWISYYKRNHYHEYYRSYLHILQYYTLPNYVNAFGFLIGE